MGRRLLAIASLVLIATTARSLPATSPFDGGPGRDQARDVLRRSLEAISGGRRILAIRRTARISTFHLADRDHVGPPYAADVADVTITDDDAGRRLRVALISPATGKTFAADTVTTGPDQVTTIREGAQIRAVRGSPARPLWQLDQPIAALRLAAEAPDLRLAGREIVHQVSTLVLTFTSGGFAVRLYVGEANLLPLRAEATVTMPAEIAWASRGDLVEKFEWQNWTMSRGVRQPYQVDTFLNGEPMESLVVTALELDPSIDERAFVADPKGFAQLEARGARDVDDLPLGRADRPIEEIAPGIVQIPGPWYATLVRQDDGIVVIDAPISSGYSAKVLAEAARRFPGMPVKAVVSTTGFNWHTAGLREYAARGIPIYALRKNEGVVRALLTAPHSIRPDTLSRSRRKPTLRLVDDRLEVGKGENRLQFIALRRGSSPMLMVYLPGRRLLHTAEAVQPLGPGGALLFPESLREVSEEVKDRRLDVERMIGMHMSPTAWLSVGAALEADRQGRTAPVP